ncbi:GNAT family N-acetyltransferase [Synechococcales cyanobacterium C]|uniref:GNAT family N-acetyltransferase n=1 Tax=Petrachloros mirabilis ULC683 TaxID=2781853 RepID=A0A8K2A6X8_9CYAN|nr:GNAT family N-acetyltransferase [Petrachloros mirabilis]NCJ05560.1 GNAT family N-acetyltransferase [Petrachloros mirabilis ULC683]
MDHRQIVFCEGLSPTPPALPTPEHLHQLQQLFQVSAFWAPERRIEDLAAAIAHSCPVISVWNQSQLIGFARATSDSVYRATIWDVIIHPDYRGAGLGRQLVQTVLAHPQVNRVERVYLMTTHQQSFYERIGFEPNISTTMVLHQNQASLGVQALPELLPQQIVPEG